MKVRLLLKEDLSTRVEWMNNPFIYQTMHFIPPISLENTIEWYERNKLNPSRYDMVFEDDNGHLVAMGGLTSIENKLRKAEFYIFVNPNRQREGIGTLATTLLCKYGFEVLNLHKIYLYTNATNMGARKTYEKVGFSLEGEFREEMIVNDKFENRLYYGLLQKEFKGIETQLEFIGTRT